jgi:hypothetical protein
MHPNISVTNPLSTADSSELLGNGYSEASILKTRHYTATSKEVKQLLGFECSCLSGLVFQYDDLEGNPKVADNGRYFLRVKPNRTLEQIVNYENTGKKNGKYHSPANSGSHFYYSRLLPKYTWKQVADRPSIPVVIVEGEKKADILNQEGITAIGIGGVYSWKTKVSDTSEKLESAPCKDFSTINWKNRKVILCPDSDVLDSNKPQIAAAMKELAEHLITLGANPSLIVLPYDIEGIRLGADDFINRFGVTAFNTFIKYSQPALIRASKSPKAGMKLNLQPPHDERKAHIVSYVLSENYAYRHGIGWYAFNETNWEYVPKTQILKIFLTVYGNQGWFLDTCSSISYAEKILPALCVLPENKWNSHNILIFSNGRYDASLRNFREGFDKSLYSTYSPLPFPYISIYQEPSRFLKFLDEATAGEQATIELIQAILRYAWTPMDVTKAFKLSLCFDFYGIKGTGKSTILQVIADGFGEENIHSADPQVFSSPESLSALLNKRAAISMDISGYIKDPGVLNSVISNEPVRVRKLYTEPIQTRLGVKIFRGYNEVIATPHGSEGQDRRLLVISFKNPPKRKDINLADKLRAEMSQIMNWAFQLDEETMVQRLETRNNSSLADEASKERFITNNHVYQYLQSFHTEGCEKILTKELYSQYVVWMSEQSLKPISAIKFRKELERLGGKQLFKENGMPWTSQRYPFYSLPDLTVFDTHKHLGYTFLPTEPPRGDFEPQVTEVAPFEPQVTEVAPFEPQVTEVAPFEPQVTEVAPFEPQVTEFNHEYESISLESREFLSAIDALIADED